MEMTYVPNIIGIPTHGVDLWRHGLEIGERNLKSPIEPSQGEKRRKKKRDEEEIEREPGDSWQVSHAEWISVTELHHIRRRDSTDVTQTTWSGV
jgi:hypothetical protein